MTLPPAREGAVSRSNLADVVRDRRPPVVALSAPAGYGKSTLMAEWGRRDPRPSAWVSLDRADNEPMALFRLVACALDGCHSLDPDVFEALSSRGVPILGRVVPRLASSLANAGPLLLLLDDLHEVDSQASRDALTLLVDHLPAGSTVAAASRGDVWLNLARRRVRGELLEIGARELAFDTEEAAQLMAGAGLHLRDEEIAQLTQRTEGWPAGLYLGVLALRDSPDAAQTLERYGGDDRFVADYLRWEILDRTPDELRRFLTRTAVLDDLCASLCDHTLESTTSAATLSALEQSNLFLVPLDHRREWYRYHGLFRDLLLAELGRTEPALVPELHRRAADWCEVNGRPEAAIEHAFASGDRDRAAVLVAGGILGAWTAGRGPSNRRWLSRFTDAEMDRHPWLAVVAAWLYATDGLSVEAARWADAAERGSFVGAPPDGSASIESARAMLRTVMAAHGVAAMMADAELAVTQEQPGSPWRSSALYHLYWARYVSGDQAGAEAALEDVIELLRRVDHPNHVQALAHRSLFEMDRGEWTAANVDLRRAREQIDASHLGEYGTIAITFAASARLAHHDQDQPSALGFLGHAMRLRPQRTWVLPCGSVHLRLVLARVLLAMGDQAGAGTMLREIDEIRRHRPDLGTLVQQVDALRNQLAALPAGTIGVSTLTSAELRLLPYLQTHLTYKEIGQRLYVSLNTVRTQTQAIYRKLDVDSRSGAVEQARRVGLLGG